MSAEKPSLSFRLKLMLAMMLVVIGVSGTTLLVTQRRVQAAYEEAYRKNFEQQIDYFTTLQEARLGSVKDQCLKLAQSVRLIAALDQTDIEASILYDNASDELKSVLGSVVEGGRDARGPRGARARFVRFLDSKGEVIQPPEEFRTRPGMAAGRKPIEQRLARMRAVLDRPEQQQVGYLSFADNNRSNGPAGPRAREIDRPALQEIIVTRFIDPARGATLGALVLGFPLPDLVPTLRGPRALESSNRVTLIQSGILMEDRFHAGTNIVSEAAGEEIATLVSRELARNSKAHADFECLIETQPYRIFYESLNQNSAFPPAYQVCLYSLSEARRAQREVTWKIIGAGLVALAGALLVSFLLSHGLSVPIRELVAGTQEIQKGNLQVQVRVRSRDEIGHLAASFNDMAQGLALKEKYRSLLNLVADEKVARRLMSGEVALGGQLRDVSVLFCDIRGFTAVTEKMPPEEVIQMLNEHMTALTEVVKQHNGVVDKFVGDLIMAVFGAPVSHGNDAWDAAKCALDLLDARKKLNRSSRYSLEMGIGVASGKAVAGCMGSEHRLNYTVLGERVNLASRLCHEAGPGIALLDETTTQVLAGAIEVEPAPIGQLKGYQAAVKAFRLLRISSVTPNQNPVTTCV